MKYYHKLYLALLGFILILTPTFNFGLESFYNEKRMAEGVVLVIGSVIFLSILYRNKINIPKWLSYSALLFFGFLFIEAILFSKYFNWALLEIGWYVSLVQLIFVLVYFQVLKPDSMQKLLMIAVYCLAFIYCFKVAETVIQSHLDPEWPIWPRVVKYKLLINGEIFGPDPFLGFSNFRFLNHLHTWSIPIMIGGYLKYNKNLILGFKILSIITL